MENYCATVGELNLNVKLTGETVRIYFFLFFFFPFTVLIHSYRHNYMERYSSYLIEIGIDRIVSTPISSLSPDLHTCVLPARIVFARNRSFRPINVSSRKRIMCSISSAYLPFLPSYQLFTRSKWDALHPFRRKGNFLAPSMTSEILSKLTHSMYK